MVPVLPLAVDEAEHAEEIKDSSEEQQGKLHEDQQNVLSQGREQHSPESILPVTPSFGICRSCSLALLFPYFCVLLETFTKHKFFFQTC